MSLNLPYQIQAIKEGIFAFGILKFEIHFLHLFMVG